MSDISRINVSNIVYDISDDTARQQIQQLDIDKASNSELNNLDIKIQKQIGLSYQQFGAKGDGKTNDYEAIKACHLAANDTKIPVINRGGTYYVTGATIPVETDVYNFGVTYIVGNSNLKLYPLFRMDHDSETSQQNVLLSDVFSDQNTVTSAYRDKAFVITTGIALGTSEYTGQTGEVVEEPIIACGNRALLMMEKYATAQSWTVDINHITDATEHGYTWHGGIIRQKDATEFGICFLEVARNNCVVEALEIAVENAKEENAVIVGYTANNITVCDVKSFTDTLGVTWGNYSVSLRYASNLLVRNLKSSSHIDRSSTITSTCVKNYTLRDSVTRTYDVHWNAWGILLVDSCFISDSAHVGYGDGTFLIKSSTITGTVNPRVDYSPIFHGNIVFEDSVVGFIYIDMTNTADETRDTVYFNTIKPPTFYLNRVKYTDSRFLFWSGINAEMEALLDANIDVYVSNMALGNLSNAYGNQCFRLVAQNLTNYSGISTWKNFGRVRTDSEFIYRHQNPTFTNAVTSVGQNAKQEHFERGGVENLNVSAVITADVAAWSAIMTITDTQFSPGTSIYFIGLVDATPVPMYVDTNGNVFVITAINVTNKRFTFNVSW